MGHITEANRPIAGKAITAIFAGPNRAAVTQSRAPVQVPISTLRLSKIFSKSMPMKQPAVSSPQNHETADAPVVWGSKPWYWARNFEIQSAVPCSEPTEAKTLLKKSQTIGLRARLPSISQDP